MVSKVTMTNMPINAEKWLDRAQSFSGRVGQLNAAIKSGEAVSFAISMATTFYGAGSQQVEALRRASDKYGNDVDRYEFAKGCIANMVAEVRGGLVQNIRLTIAGEILADLIAMAHEALGEKAVHVAAVLTTAAFEDLMRRLAQEKAGITARIKLEQILIELKEKGVLQGGEPGVAQSFLKFRNDSLHADWNNVTDVQVAGCLGLVESLTIKHFS
jgi:hypothetical protein